MKPEKAIKILKNYHHGYFGYKIDEVHEAHKIAIEAIKNSTITVADRPKGEWKLDSIGPYCSECELHPDYTSDFCPFCGADMRDNKKETTFDDYLNKQLKDPEFKKEWEKLCDEDEQKGGAE